MEPIVNGLEDTYNQDIDFVYLNANTDGADAFQALGLRGHPAVVIFNAEQEEIFRAIGFQDEALLLEVIDDALPLQ